MHNNNDLIMHLHSEVFIHWVSCRSLDSIRLGGIYPRDRIVVTAEGVQKVVSFYVHWKCICIFSFEPARQ